MQEELESIQTPGQQRVRHQPLQLGRLLPWLETLLWQQVLDVADGEQLQMLGLHVEKGKLWQFAGREEELLDGHQKAGRARFQAWQSLFPPRK